MDAAQPQPGDLVIHGSGDHGRVVAEAARSAGWTVRGWRDEAKAVGERIDDLPVLDDAATVGRAIHVAIGDNPTRQQLAEAWVQRNVALATVIHPAAWVSRSARIEPGVFIAPAAVVHVQAVIGRAAIINTGAVIEHHVRIGAAAHIAPGAVLTGRVDVGIGALIGAGAVVRPGITIGKQAIIGAGAVVVADVPDGVTVVGNPARPLG